MNKTLLFFSFMAAAMMMSCQNKSEGKAETAEEQELTIDTLAFEQDTLNAKVRILVEYPVSGPESLCESIREHISFMLGDSYSRPLTADGNPMVSFYGRQKLQELQEDYNDMLDEVSGEFTPNDMFYADLITLAANTEKYVTYTTYQESYEGGAHGMSFRSGMTFRKSDGANISRHMFNDKVNTEAFRLLIVNGLIDYFNNMSEDMKSEEELAEMLLVDTKKLMLPEWPLPYLTPKGVVIAYSPYDIAPYAAGIPTFTLPLDVVRPYLTDEARELTEP